jgi:hypothetical protein
MSGTFARFKKPKLSQDLDYVPMVKPTILPT